VKRNFDEVRRRDFVLAVAGSNRDHEVDNAETSQYPFDGLVMALTPSNSEKILKVSWQNDSAMKLFCLKFFVLSRLRDFGFQLA
jgi:hypothetical protein